MSKRKRSDYVCWFKDDYQNQSRLKNNSPVSGVYVSALVVLVSWYQKRYLTKNAMKICENLTDRQDLQYRRGQANPQKYSKQTITEHSKLHKILQQV